LHQHAWLIDETFTVVAGVESASNSSTSHRHPCEEMMDFGLSARRNSTGPTGPFSFGFSFPVCAYFAEACRLCPMQWM
jgi:hypothetical protein